MAKSRQTKIISALLVSLALSVFMAVPAFAQELAAGTTSTTTQTYMDDTAGWYTQGAESTYTTTEAVNVTVTIEDKVSSAAAIDYVQIPVTLPAVSAGKAYTVRDALMAVNSNQSTYKFLDTYGNEIDTGDHYFKYVSYNSTNYGPSNDTVTYDGWCFRIDGKMPLESGTASSNPIGAAISNAYIKNGQQINVYFDDLYDGAKENRFTKIYSVDYDGSTMTVNVKYAFDWFTPISYDWHIYDYANYTSDAITVQVINSSNTVVQSASTNASGNAVLSVGALASGSYTVKAVGVKASLLKHAKTSDQVTYTV